MERYSEYKKTSVQWINEIPKGWVCKPMKYYLSSKITDGPHETPEFISDGIPFLSVDSIKDGELVFDDCRKISESEHERFKKKCIVEKNDILMGKAASVGKIAQVKVDFEFSIWSPLALLKPDTSKINASYFEYFMKSNYAQYNTNLLSTFNTQRNISMADIPSIYFTTPIDTDEQKNIVRFLDKKISEIDTIIEAKKKLVKLYEEEKETTINNALTKGINSDVKLKPSGVEWLGDIPEHWSVSRINRIIKVKDGTHDTPKYVDNPEGNYPLVTSKDFKDGEIDFDSTKYISEEDHLEIIKRSNTENGDILMSMIGGNIGNMVLVNSNKSFSIKNVCLFKTSHDPIVAKHLYYILKSDILRKQIDIYSRGGAQGFLSLGDLRSLIYFVIPLDERTKIVDYLDIETVIINKRIIKAKKLITLLTEYRTTLISEVVTGKIKVTR
jgi:type I restriction enzyme S subunit